jgi:hypothetical protein
MTGNVLLSAKKFKCLKKTDLILIGIVWLIMQLSILLFFGINDKDESVKYIGLANKWLNGDRDFRLHNIFYSGYVAIHVLIKWFKLPYKSMYGVQLFFSAMSLFYYIRILCAIQLSRIAVVMSALLYATCFLIQEWVRFLYTDSIFCSLLVIASFFLLSEQNSLWNKIIFWVLLVALPIFRPVGFLFVAVACFHWTMNSPKKNIVNLSICCVYMCIIGVVIQKTFSTSEQYYYPIHSLHNIEANVICANQDNLLNYQITPFTKGMSVFSYLYNNPGMTIRLFLFRFYKVFSMGRSFFSPIHNLLLFLMTFIYYILAIVGAMEILKHKKRKIYFLIAGLMLFSFPLVIFCVEWSGRFSLPVMLYVLLIGSLGIEGIVKIFKKQSKMI